MGSEESLLKSGMHPFSGPCERESRALRYEVRRLSSESELEKAYACKEGHFAIKAATGKMQIVQSRPGNQLLLNHGDWSYESITGQSHQRHSTRGTYAYHDERSDHQPKRY